MKTVKLVVQNFYRQVRNKAKENPFFAFVLAFAVVGAVVGIIQALVS